MSDFAIIEAGGKQYRVAAGEKLRVEKIGIETPATGAKILFDKVLLRSADGRLTIGAPHVPGAKVEARIVGNGRGEKKIVFKYHSKTRYRKKKGHRQPFTEVTVEAI